LHEANTSCVALFSDNVRNNVFIEYTNRNNQAKHAATFNEYAFINQLIRMGWTLTSVSSPLQSLSCPAWMLH